MPWFADAQTDGPMVRRGLYPGKELSQTLERVGLQAVKQWVHAVIIHAVSHPPQHLDLQRLSDYALEPGDLLPLVQTLEADLTGALADLNRLLSAQPDGDSLHHRLHALKGMAGMFAVAALHLAITEADEACRHGQVETGMGLAHGLTQSLQQWLGEVRAWLRSYS
jgi:HPt (histidine-containing phosphotransfer) domain-containing protein